jgi:hypothetical protein
MANWEAAGTTEYFEELLKAGQNTPPPMPK